MIRICQRMLNFQRLSFENGRKTEETADLSEKGIPVAAIVKGKFTSYFAESGPPKKPANPDNKEGKEEDLRKTFTI